MSNPAVLTIFDGDLLRSIDLNLPELQHGVTGAQLLEISESKVSQSLSGLSLPPHLKNAAISQVSDGDEVNFRRTEFNQQQASEKLGVFFSAVADALKDTPIVVSILDGTMLKMFLEDEDDFAMLAENLFTDLDEEDKGKLCKSEIRKALVHMGVEMGVPPLSEFPMLDDIVKKHDADGDEELGQAQFAELLQPVLQDIADVLHEKPITIVQNVEIFTGSRIHKILGDEKKLKCLVEKTILEDSNGKDSQGWVKTLIIKNGKELGLPPLSSDNEQVALLYETIFSQLNNKEKETADASTNLKEEFMDALKDILKKFEELLETTPVYSATNL
ncbi:EF-hand domain pair [Arabidopsis suecica]|uniref:EF-hand domain pair n=1 Tax=Arabidopsis suecica TaxID=45249 RepID=A0A8T1ZFF9_ARASU|nr:EF-hand domain pair [Arabidopsis suecica]